jgi:hypothetical protein
MYSVIIFDSEYALSTYWQVLEEGTIFTVVTTWSRVHHDTLTVG